MAIPSEKNESLEQTMIRIFGFDRRESIKSDVCIPSPTGCGGPAVEFSSEISAKEYTISGFCQKCQTRIFG